MHRKNTAKLLAAIAAVSGLIAGQKSARAGTNGVWNPIGFTGANGSGAWSTASNWTGNTIANGVDGIADFSTLDITADTTVHLDTPRTIGQLTFGDNTTPSNNWIVDNNGVSTNILTLATSTASAPVINVNNQTATINTTLAGTQGFTKTGSGILNLGGINTYTGTTTISGGTLVLSGGLVGGSLLNINAALGVTTSNGNVVRVLDQSGNADSLGTSGVTLSTINGRTAFNFNGASQLTNVASGNLTSETIFAVIQPAAASSGPRAIIGSTATGGVELRLNAANQLDFLRQQQADLSQSTGTIAPGSVGFITVTNSGTQQTYNVNGTTNSVNASSAISATNTTTTIGGRNGAEFFNGNIGAMLVYNGVLNATQIAQVQAYLNTAFTTGLVTSTPTPVNITSAGAALALAGDDQAISSLTGVSGSNVYLGSGNLTIGSDNTPTVYAGNISDTGTGSVGTGGGIQKVGSGTLSLTGSLTYTGHTTVDGGTLSIGGNFAPTGATTATGGLLSIAGSVSGAGTFTANTGGTISLAGNNSGTGRLSVGYGGLLILSGSNTNTGATILHDGATLRLIANAGNTTAGSSNVFGSAAANSFQVSDNGGAAVSYSNIQLRSDSSVTYANTSTTNNSGNTTLNFDVNNVAGINGSGPTGNTLTFGTFNTFNTIFNVTGGNGYTMSFPAIANPLGANVTFNAISANLSVGPVGTPTGTLANAVLTFGGAMTSTLNGLVTTANTTSGTIAKTGTGTLNIITQQTLVGTIAPQQGTFGLNFSLPAVTATTNLAPATSTLSLQGGTLLVTGNAAATNSQTFAATSVANGSSNVNLAQNSAANLSATLGALSRTAGATVDFTLPTTGTVNTTTGTASTLITSTTSVTPFPSTGVAYATVGGVDWAAKDPTNTFIVGGSSISGFYTPDTTTTISGNADVGTVNTTLAANAIPASLRFNDGTGARTLNLGGFTLSTGGILVTSNVSNNLETISNGVLTGAGTVAALDLPIIQNNTANSLTISAAIANATAGATGLTKTGAGSVILSGANNYTGTTIINGGTLEVSGGTTGTIAADMQIAAANSAVATLQVDPGATVNTARVIVGGNTANSLGGAGTLTQSGGTINANTFFSVGEVGTGTFNMSNGILNVNNATGANNFEVATFANASGTVNISGGSQINLLNNASLVFGAQGNLVGNTGTVNQNGGTVTFYSNAGTAVGGTGALRLGVAGVGTYTYNLNGGSLIVPSITHALGASAVATSVGNFNFNGGTLKAAAASTAFMSNLSAATVKSGGALIDSNSFNITIGQSLLHDTSVTTDGGLTKSNTGVLTLTGANTYNGATAVNGGTLLITGSMGSGNVSVANTATLAGSTVLTGNVSLASGASLTPGNSGVGTLTAGGLSFATGSIGNFEVTSTSVLDQVNVLNSGGLSVAAGSKINLFQTGTTASFATNGTYTLFNIVGGLGSGVATNFTVSNAAPGETYTFASTGTAVTVTLATGSSGSWTNATTDQLWTTPGNWVNSFIPNAASVPAVFGSSLVGTNGTVQLNGNKTVGGVTFDNAVAFTLEATAASPFSGSTLTFDNGASPAAISANSGPATGSHIIEVPITLNSDLSINAANATSLNIIGSISGGSHAIAVNGTGTGTVIFSGANTYGTTNVNSGTLQIGNNGTTGSLGTGTTTVASGANLVFNLSSGTTLPVPLITGSGNVAVNSGTISLAGNDLNIPVLTLGTATTTGNITDNTATVGTSTVTTTNNSATPVTFNGSINDGAAGRKLAFVKNGSVQLVLNSASNYSGGTTLNVGLLDVNNNTALGTGTVTINSTAAPTKLELLNGITLANAIVVNAGNSVAGSGNGALTVPGAATSSAIATFSGPITFNANNTSGGHIAGPSTGGYLAFTGPITTGAGVTNAAGGLVIRSGNVQLAGGGSYTEVSISNPGTTTLGANNGISTSAVVNGGASSAGNLDLNGWDQTVAGLTQGAGGLATITNTASTTLGLTGVGNVGPGDGPGFSAVLTVNTANTGTVNNFADATPNTFPGIISGLLSLTKDGPGTLLLTNIANNYSLSPGTLDGATTIINGVLGAVVLTNEGTSGGTVSSIGQSTNAAANLVFGGTGVSNTLTSGTLRYTGAASTTTDRNFTITNGTNATFDVPTAAASLTLTGAPASGSTGGLAKAGAGTLILDSTAPAYDYSGNTTVSAGTLLVNNSISQTSSISLASGATLAGTGSIGSAATTFTHTAGTITGGTASTAGTLTLVGNLTLNGGTSLFNVNSPTIVGTGTNTQDLIAVSHALSFGATASPVTLSFSTATLPASFKYELFSYGSLANVPNLAVSSNIGRASYTVTTTTTAGSASPGEVDVNVVTGGGANNLDWNSTASSVWDTATSNWYNNTTSSVDKYFDGDNVTFKDNNAHSTPPNGQLITAISLNTTVQPSSITVSSNTNNYTFSGSGAISGLTGLAKTGSSTLTVQTNNNYTGNTTISAGTVNVGGSTASGSLGTGTVTNTANLIFSRTDATLTVPNTITNNSTAGTGLLTYNGGGTLTFSGPVTQSSITVSGAGSTAAFTNAVTIDNGITVSGALGFTSSGGISGTGPITINGTGNSVISGTNTYSGAVVVSAGNLFPGSATAFGSTAAGTTISGTGQVFFTSAQNVGNENFTLDGAGSTTQVLIHTGGSATSTIGGTLSVISGSLIKFDGGSGLILSGAGNGIAIQSANNSSVTVNGDGGSALFVGGNVSLGTGVFTTTEPTLNFVPAASTTATISSVLAGTSTVNINSGTVLYTAANNYTGNTNVSGGNLALSATGSMTSSTTVGNAATAGLTPTLTGTGTTTGSVTLLGSATGSAGHLAPGTFIAIGNAGNTIGTLKTGAFTFNSGSILDYLFGATASSQTTVTGAITLPSTGTVTLNINDNGNNGGLGSIGVGTYKLFSYSGALVNFPAATPGNLTSLFTLNNNTSLTGDTFSITDTGQTAGTNEIDLVITGAGPNLLLWDHHLSATGNGTDWDATAAAASQNWVNTTSNTAASFTNGDAVTFDSSANHGSFAVNIASAVLPSSVNVSNTTGTYTFSGAGSIGGTGGLTKSNSGALVIQNSGGNTYSGNTAVNGGTLTLADNSTIGTNSSHTVSVAAGATAHINGLLTGTPNVTASGSAGVGSTLTVGINDANNNPTITSTTPILARNWNTLTIGSGSSVSLDVASTHANRTVLVVSALTFSDTAHGTLNLSNNDLVVHNGNTGSVSTTGSIASQLKAGFNAGTGYWNGAAGITSTGLTSAAADSRYLTTLGYRTGGIPFDGMSTTAATDVLVKYTYYGDADLNGTLNGSDYQQIDGGFGSQTTGSPLSGWSNGDFNYDGKINGSDFALIDNAMNQLAANPTLTNPLALIAAPASLIAAPADLIAAPAATSAVPEPTTLGLLGLGAMGLLGRRKRRHM